MSILQKLPSTSFSIEKAQEVLSYHACKLWGTQSHSDSFSVVCGKIWIITETVTERFRKETVSDVLAEISMGDVTNSESICDYDRYDCSIVPLDACFAILFLY